MIEYDGIEHDVVVILLNYKTWQETLDEIRMMKSIPGIKCDYMVVDNCSPNDSYEQLQGYTDKYGFKLIKSDNNDGYASGNNIGLREAERMGYRYAWIMNNDIIFDKSFSLDTALSIFHKADDIAVVSPDVYAPNGKLFNRDSKRWTFNDMTFGMMHYKKTGRNIDDRGGWGYVYRPQGCSMILDIKKCSEVGFMDEHTFLYCEEDILAERLLSKDYRCACDTTNKIIHNHSYTVHSAMDRKKIIETNLASFKYYLTEYRGFKGLKLRVCMWFQKMKLSYLEK